MFGESENDRRGIRESQNSFPGESGSKNVSGKSGNGFPGFPVTALCTTTVHAQDLPSPENNPLWKINHQATKKCRKFNKRYGLWVDLVHVRYKLLI